MEPSEAGQSMGHEAIGAVEDVGPEVRTLKRGDLMIMPFAISDGTCEFCHAGLQTACVHVAFFGNNGVNGAQAEALRIPYADGTLFPLSVGEDDALMPSVLTLSDVMGTSHHAAVVANVAPGKIAAVVGDGARRPIRRDRRQPARRRADHHPRPSRVPDRARPGVRRNRRRVRAR
jgi:threonine dehydrogenase-like Zn-dependent dehydrogenase